MGSSSMEWRGSQAKRLPYGAIAAMAGLGAVAGLGLGWWLQPAVPSLIHKISEVRQALPASPPLIVDRSEIRPAAPSGRRTAPKEEQSRPTSPNGTLLQAGVFRLQPGAHTLAEELRQKGYPASVVTEHPYFVVVVGPLTKPAEVTEVRAKLQQSGYQTLVRHARLP